MEQNEKLFTKIRSELTS